MLSLRHVSCRVPRDNFAQKRTFAANCVLAAGIFLLVACGDPPAGPPAVRTNPTPTQAYEIVLTIPDPPAQIRNVTGEVQFDIEGVKEDCMPYADSIAGIKPKSSFAMPLDFERRKEGTYTGTVYQDSLMDEDYYGLGVCRWKLTGVIAAVHLGKAKQEAVLFGDKIVQQKSELNYCMNDAVTSLGCITPLSKTDVIGDRFVVSMHSRKINQ